MPPPVCGVFSSKMSELIVPDTGFHVKMNELIVPDTGLQIKMNELIVPDTGFQARTVTVVAVLRKVAFYNEQFSNQHPPLESAWSWARGLNAPLKAHGHFEAKIASGI